nr:hypothetical protein [uncultured bacterium]
MQSAPSKAEMGRRKQVLSSLVTERQCAARSPDSSRPRCTSAALTVRVSSWLAIAVMIASCAADPLPESSPSTAASTVFEQSPAPRGNDPGTVDDPSTSKIDASPSAAHGIVVNTAATGVDFDRRLLGTNVPAWLGPERLASPQMITAARDSGTSLVRMPGGSWSNSYDWHACEIRDELGCFWTWAARPSDFIDFLQATELSGMWTVSINESAQQAAALVAFFNGRVGDQRTIGSDRFGVDWGTVDRWATLRVDGGNPEPLAIDLWEVGNEVYGAKPASGGSGCADFGWENAWTCDGEEYVMGNGEHDGFLAIREAMIEVDPEIEVGAVGVSDPTAWANWGNKVIESAGTALDFYVAHHYGFDTSPDIVEALRLPGQAWPTIGPQLRDALGEGTPIAVTEYNLVARQDGDTTQSMTRAVNMLYIADTIGQLARAGVSIANQWTLASGTADSGTNYGMVDADSYARFPQFHAVKFWSRAGQVLYPADVSGDLLNVYPTRHDDGRWTVLMINLGPASRVTLEMTGLSTTRATVASVGAPNLSSPTVSAPTVRSVRTTGEALVIEAWSISIVEIDPAR